jgi:hypothetical protein
MSLLSILAKTEEEHAAEETVKSSMRAEFAKRLVFGSGWSIGAAIVFGAFEILRSDPHDAFPLLVAWGPKAIGSIIALYVVYDLAKIVLNLVGRAIHAFEKMGAGLQKIGDKDDRAVQEMQTLTAVTAQRSEKTHTMLQGYHEANVAWGARMEGKLDKAIEEWKKP